MWIRDKPTVLNIHINLRHSSKCTLFTEVNNNNNLPLFPGWYNFWNCSLSILVVKPNSIKTHLHFLLRFTFLVLTSSITHPNRWQQLVFFLISIGQNFHLLNLLLIPSHTTTEPLSNFWIDQPISASSCVELTSQFRDHLLPSWNQRQTQVLKSSQHHRPTFEFLFLSNQHTDYNPFFAIQNQQFLLICFDFKISQIPFPLLEQQPSIWLKKPQSQFLLWFNQNHSSKLSLESSLSKFFDFLIWVKKNWRWWRRKKNDNRIL